MKKLGLDSLQKWSWALYDFGNSGFATTIMAVMLPIYFFDVAAKTLPEHMRTAYWGYGAGLSLLIIAPISPILGAFADALGKKKFFIGLFTFIGCLSCFALSYVNEGEWLYALLVYIIGNVAFSGAMVFYDSLLPHVSDHGDSNSLSLAGYAMGYLGGGLLLALNLTWVLKPTFWGFLDKSSAVRASFMSVGIWWLIFSLPLLLFVKEPPATKQQSTPLLQTINASFLTLKKTFRDIRSQKQVLLFLIAFWIYSDGIGTIIKMATTFGREIGIDQSNLIMAMLATQFLGLPFTFIYTPLVRQFSAKTGLIFSLVIYSLICILGYIMTEAWHFWVLAIMIAMVQGGSQALSRSIFSSLIPKNQSSEYFSFYSVSSKFAGVFGPLLFGMMAQGSGSGRGSIVFLVLFFVVGAGLVSRVNCPP